MPSFASVCIVAFGLLCGLGFSLVELGLSQHFGSFCSVMILPFGVCFPFACFLGVGV
jgi:hypothetical protein